MRVLDDSIQARIVWRVVDGQLVPVEMRPVTAKPDVRRIPEAPEAQRPSISVPRISIQSSINAVPLPIPRRPNVEACAPADLEKEIAVDRIRQIHRAMVRRGECA